MCKKLMIMAFCMLLTSPMQLFSNVTKMHMMTEPLQASEKTEYEDMRQDDIALIQLPTRAVFKYTLHDEGFDEILEKTGIMNVFYHNKLSNQVADPIRLDVFVNVINSIYDEYAIAEGHKPERVRLVRKSKPLLYEILLQNNSQALAQLHDRGIL